MESNGVLNIVLDVLDGSLDRWELPPERRKLEQCNKRGKENAGRPNLD